MFGRLWSVVSAGFTLWTIMNTLKKMDESKSELLNEFYSTLTPEEQKLFKNYFGNVGIPKIEPVHFPQVQVPKGEVIAPTQVTILEAQI